MAEDGSMARLPQLTEFCKKHFDLLLCSNADLIHYRLQQDTLVHRIENLPIDTDFGRFELRAMYETVADRLLHLALCLRRHR